MSGSGGFQQQAYPQPALAVAGDFASMNPFFTLDVGAGGLVAGPNGLTIGLFAWTTPPTDIDGTPTIANNSGSGPVAGFVHREGTALITQYLENAGMTIPQGFACTLCVGGDFWVVNNGTTFAQIGQKAFAYLANGEAAFAAAGSVFGGASATSSSVAAETFSVTGSITNGILTVTAVGSGTVYPGSTISGTGIPTGTEIVSQITPLLAGESAGGIGRYYVSAGQNLSAASTTVSGTYGLLTIGTATGTFAVGDELSGSGVAANTFITANVSGAGGTGGTMVVNNNTVVSSTTITASSAVETPWYAVSQGAAGQLVKISDHYSAQLSG